jgi:hypothetical protein
LTENPITPVAIAEVARISSETVRKYRTLLAKNSTSRRNSPTTHAPLYGTRVIKESHQRKPVVPWQNEAVSR